MSIHLCGGQWMAEGDAAVTSGFLEEAADRARTSDRDAPRIAFLLVGEAGEWTVGFPASFSAVAPCVPIVHVVAEGDEFASEMLSDIDALVIGGGLTPAYLHAVQPIVDEIRLLVGDGLPYFGFSAGAAIAAELAIVGGWLIEGVPVCPPDAGEDLEEVLVQPGLGLVDVAIDVHAAQWGTIARAISAVESGLIDSAIAIDERTALVVEDDGFLVVGRGHVWQVDAADEGVAVSTLGASAFDPDAFDPRTGL